MIVIGLTGSVGMGKSTVASMVKRLGFPVYNADKAVHDALRKGTPTAERVAKAFPEALQRGRINRALLGKSVFADPQKLHKLEKILHPAIQKAMKVFIQDARRQKAKAALLDVPLLFETNTDRLCTLTLCVTAPVRAQKARVLARPNMTEEKLRAIVKRQLSDAEKRKKADYVIPTGNNLSETRRHLKAILHAKGLIAPTKRGVRSGQKRPDAQGRSTSRKA